jgi:ABC-type transport system involved in Fe-S cluster assembly fused permease/ATPase subunit
MAYLLAQKSGDGQDAYAGASAVAQQVISAIRTVNAFNGQERECERYEKKLEEAEKSGIKKALVSAAGLGTVFCIIFGTYGLAFW